MALTGTMGAAAVAAASALPGVVGALVSASLSPLSDDELLDVLRGAERARRQLEAFDAVLIAELGARNVAGRLVMRGSKQLLSGVLNLSPAESSTRVRHAHELGPRLTLSGEALPPLLPLVSGARVEGSITARHVDVIIRAMTVLRSASLPVDEQAEAEAFLVEQALCFDPGTLSGIARQLLDTLNPDGRLADEQSQRRRRFLSCLPRGDGMYRLTADLDTETAALAITVLHSLAAPQPGKTSGDRNEPGNGGTAAQHDTAGQPDDGAQHDVTGQPGGGGGGGARSGERDERTPGQRMHDAFRSVLKFALRSGELPVSGGVPATVLITMTADQFETRTGLAATSYGQKLSVEQALRLADEASIAWIVHNSQGGILNYGTTRRTASTGQTLALIARDRGCAFPGCTDPPEWRRETPHHTLGTRRTHQPGQPLPPLRPPPRPHQHRRLDHPPRRQAPLVHSTSLDRPHPTTTTQHPTVSDGRSRTSTSTAYPDNRDSPSQYSE